MRFRFPHQGSQASRGSRPGRPIARRLNLDRKTVRRFRATALDQLLASARECRPIGILEPFKAYLNTHFTEAQGQVDGTQLSLEIQARGYRGSRQVVRKHLAALGRAPHCRSEPMSPAQARSHPGSCGQGSCRLATRGDSHSAHAVLLVHCRFFMCRSLMGSRALALRQRLGHRPLRSGR